MGWGSGKEALIAENAAAKRENELLREQLSSLKDDVKDLRNQLRYAHEALVAKESPEAWRDRKYHEELAALDANKPEMSEEEKKARELQVKRAEIAKRYLHQLEQPLFTDRDDMIEQLTRAHGLPMVATESLHGNDES